jgi:hypothetical protein
VTQHRKHRGYESQRIVARFLAGRGWPHAYAIGAGEAGDDIQGTLDIAVEVKARTGFSPLSAINGCSNNLMLARRAAKRSKKSRATEAIAAITAAMSVASWVVMTPNT